MDRFTSMQVFVKVADLGSFAAAANELKLSPAMVAKHIRTLEERLQVTLIRRTTRRQSLTDVGLSFLERCRSILGEVEAAENLAAESQSAPRGLLRVNAPMTFGSTSLARALPNYLRDHPAVSVELTITDRMVDLVDEGFDAVIRIGELADTSLRARAMTPYEMALCAAPAYLANHPTPQHPADLSDHACLGFAHWAPRNEWTFQGPGGRDGKGRGARPPYRQYRACFANGGAGGAWNHPATAHPASGRHRRRASGSAPAGLAARRPPDAYPHSARPAQNPKAKQLRGVHRPALPAALTQ